MARMRIVIVDDDLTVASELEARLRAIGYEVAAIAKSGAEADTIAATSAPELALINIALRGTMNGLAAAEAVLRHRSIPVVFMGADARDGSHAWPDRLEPCEYLQQPFSDRELRVTIELALCRHGAAEAVHELDGFFSVSVDMFCFLDFNGYFKRLNPAWEKTLGFTREELMSRPFIEFVHPDDRVRTLNQNSQVRGGGRATGFENRYRCKDGSYRWLLWNASPRSAEGVIYSVAHDITARKQAEAERTLLVSRLEASLAEVRSLQDILPICMYCKQIRDDKDYWQSVEGYISEHTNTQFSHSICPSCLTERFDKSLTEYEDEPEFGRPG